MRWKTVGRWVFVGLLVWFIFNVLASAPKSIRGVIEGEVVAVGEKGSDTFIRLRVTNSTQVPALDGQEINAGISSSDNSWVNLFPGDKITLDCSIQLPDKDSNAPDYKIWLCVIGGTIN